MKTFYKFILAACILSLFSCGGKIVDPAFTSHYVYVNTLNEPVTLSLRNSKSNNLYFDTIIKAKDSFAVKQIEEGPSLPFWNYSADSCVLLFNDGKCVSYKQMDTRLPNGGNGIFDLTNYKDYNDQVLKQKRTYRLVYEIGQKDYQLAQPCTSK